MLLIFKDMASPNVVDILKQAVEAKHLDVARLAIDSNSIVIKGKDTITVIPFWMLSN